MEGGEKDALLVTCSSSENVNAIVMSKMEF